MKVLKILALIFLVSAFLFSQNQVIPVTNTIVFTADISGILGVGIGGAFDPNVDSLFVMGFDWDDSTTIITGNRMMENTDPFNPGIYTTTLTVQSSSDSVSWKFKASPDSRFREDGWEKGPNRWHIFAANDTLVNMSTLVPRILPSFGTLPSDIDLKIYLDMAIARNRYNGLPIPLNELEFIGIKGSEDFLGNIEEGC